MFDEPVDRDERSIAVENASYRLAYLVLSFGLLLDVMFRGLVLNQASWDLLALIVLGSGTSVFYMVVRHAFPSKYAKPAILVGVIALIIAAVGSAAMTLR